MLFGNNTALCKIPQISLCPPLVNSEKKINTGNNTYLFCGSFWQFQ